MRGQAGVWVKSGNLFFLLKNLHMQILMQARPSPPWLFSLPLLRQSRGWAWPWLPTMVSVTAELQVPIPNLCCCCPHPKCKDALGEPEQRLEHQGAGEGTREDIWHRNTRAKRDTAKLMAPPAPPSWTAWQGGHAMHPPCSASRHGAVLGGFLFSSPWGWRTRLTLWPPLLSPCAPPTATRGAAQARKQPWGPRVERRALAPIGRL